MKKVMRGKGIKIISVFWVTVLVLGMYGCAEKDGMTETSMTESEVNTAVETEESESETVQSTETEELGDTQTVVYSDKCPTGAPVSATYAINELPEMKNQHYAKWDDNIYFRQYNAESFEEGALWADIGYSAEPLIEKSLMCMDAQGNLTKVGTDYGYGPMYIIDVDGNGPRIYSTLLDQDGLYKIYSCDLSGGDVKYLYSSEDSIEFIQRYETKISFMSGMFDECYIDLVTKEVKAVNLGKYSSGEWIGMDEDGMYFMVGVDGEEFHICRTTYYGDVKVLAKIPETDIITEEYMDLFVDEEGKLWGISDIAISDADFIGDKIYFMIMSYSGSGHMPASGAVYEVDKFTGECNKIFMSDTATQFHIVKQGENAWIYYPASGTVDEEWKRWAECEQFAGEQGAEAPTAVYGENDMGHLALGHYATDDGYHLYATPDNTGCSYIVLSAEEINALGIDTPFIRRETNGTVEWNVVRAEYIGDKLFFSVEISDHDIEQNIGWRDFYVRRITYDYYKDLSTGEIKLIQSY